MSKYYKTVLAIVGAIASVAYVYNVSHPNPYVSEFIAIATVLGVFTVPNSTTTPEL